MTARTNRAARARATKEKRSFTLSPKSVAFLERLRKEKKATSTSQVLDELIEDAAGRRTLEEVERSFTEYYNSLTEEEMAEGPRLGRVGAAVF